MLTKFHKQINIDVPSDLIETKDLGLEKFYWNPYDLKLITKEVRLRCLVAIVIVTSCGRKFWKDPAFKAELKPICLSEIYKKLLHKITCYFHSFMIYSVT